MLEESRLSARIHHGLTDFKGALAWKTPAVALPWPKRLYRDGAKRFLDVGFLLLALPIAAPIVALLAAVIAMDGRSPFYCQTRVGRGGRKFRFWKLRTVNRRRSLTPSDIDILT